MKPLAIAGIASLVAAFSWTPAAAQVADPQTVCAPRDELIGIAVEKYGETPTFISLSSKGVVLEILVSPKRTWTIIVTRPHDGLSCVVDYGEAWQEAAPLKKGSF